jgi:hypothetical protein
MPEKKERKEKGFNYISPRCRANLAGNLLFSGGFLNVRLPCRGEVKLMQQCA